MTTIVSREQLKAALERVYQRDKADLSKNSTAIKSKLEMSSLLILFGTLIIIGSLMGMLYFQEITELTIYLFIAVLIIIGLVISFRVPWHLSQNISELNLKLDSSFTRVQLNSVLGAVFICMFVIGAATTFIQLDTTQLETTEPELENFVINDFILGETYLDVSGDPRIEIVVNIDGPENNDNKDKVLINLESWFAGDRLEAKTTRVPSNNTIQESLLIHDLEDTSYKVELIVNNEIADNIFKPSSKDFYIYNAEVKIRGLLMNKADITVTVYNEGEPREEHMVEIIVKSSSILGSEDEESTTNDEVIESDETWKTTFTVSLDYFEGEETEFEIFLEFSEKTIDQEKIIIESS